jgi:hypothetical protein
LKGFTVIIEPGVIRAACRFIIIVFIDEDLAVHPRGAFKNIEAFKDIIEG